MENIGATIIEERFNVLTSESPEMDFAEKWNTIKNQLRGELTNEMDFEQSWKSASGKAFEKIAITEALTVLSDDTFTNRNIIAKQWKDLTSEEKQDMKVPFRKKCSGERIYLSNEPDIVIFRDNRSVAILSCKSSLRDRVSIDLYWSDVNRRENRKFLVVSAEPKSKLGTHDDPKKPREIAECLYERLYIVNGDTDYCDVVRPFSDLGDDLRSWFV